MYHSIPDGGAADHQARGSIVVRRMKNRTQLIAVLLVASSMLRFPPKRMGPSCRRSTA